MKYLFLFLFICSFSHSEVVIKESKKNGSEKKINPPKNTSESSSVSKKKRKPNQELNYNTFSQDYPADQLQGNINQKKDIEIISAKRRDEILYQANLKSITSGWDQLEKDILILRATNNTFPVFRKKYPTISEDKLYQLYFIVHPREN